MQIRRRNAVITVVLVPALIAVGVFLYQFLYVGAPLWDEWHCKKGQAPVNSDDGGSICLSRSKALPAGARWDPLGNRPFSCEGRRGWTVIYRDDDEDCRRDGLQMPEGWSERSNRP